MRNAILYLKQADPVLGSLIDSIGECRFDYLKPGFETVARSIVYQQLNGRAAGAIYARVRDLLPRRAVTPLAILQCREGELRAAGLSNQKIGYLRDLAECVRAKRLRFRALQSLSDDEVVSKLTQVKGVGPWTAQMFLIFALRRPDVLPVGDLGIRGAIRKLYGLDEVPGPKETEVIGARWRPWASVACWYLWRSVDGADAW